MEILFLLFSNEGKKFFHSLLPHPFILLRKEVENFLYLLFSAVLQILYN